MIDIIPALDLMGGKCVRLLHGNFERISEYSDDPVSIAMQFGDAGIRRLHLVDLDGARSGASVHFDVLERISSATELDIDFSGGIKTRADVERAFAAGAAFVTVGSMAVTHPEILRAWLDEFGPQRFILAADVRDGLVAIRGWQETASVNMITHVRSFAACGIDSVMITDVAKDGAMAGPSVDLYKRVRDEFSTLRLIASGGVRSVQDIDSLASVGCTGVIVGRAFYEGHISLEEMAQYDG